MQLSFLLLSSLLPIDGSQLEHAVDGPAGQEAQEVAQVAAGFDAVELAAGEERDEARVDVAASSLPTKSQFLRPMASRRSARSEPLLWIGRRPSSRKRWSATRWLRA